MTALGILSTTFVFGIFACGVTVFGALALGILEGK